MPPKATPMRLANQLLVICMGETSALPSYSHGILMVFSWYSLGVLPLQSRHDPGRPGLDLWCLSLTDGGQRTNTPTDATSLTSLGKGPHAHLLIYGDSVLPLGQRIGWRTGDASIREVCAGLQHPHQCGPAKPA